MNAQYKRMNEKSYEDSENKKNSFDKRLNNQIEVMKENMKARSEEQEETIKRLKEDQKGYKDKISVLEDKLAKAEKIRGVEKNLGEENENLKKQKEALIQAHKSELSREAE